MLQCAIYHDNKQIVGFRDDDYPMADIINIGFDSRCDVELPKREVDKGVLFSIVKLENSFLAVTASAQLFHIDERQVSEVIPKPGMDLKIGQFRVVFIGGGENSQYSLLWVVGKNKPSHAALANGVNLIGSGKNCWIQITSPDLPELCCHCRVEANDISIEPLVDSCKIKLLGKTLSANTRVETGEVFQIGNNISAVIVETADIPVHLKSTDPFYPNKTFWQLILLMSMLIFAGVFYFYSQNTSKIQPGKLINQGNYLPVINDGVNVKDVINTLEKNWAQDISNGIIKSVNSDINMLLEQKLPEELQKYLKKRSEQLKVSSAGKSLIRYYRARRLIYSLEASAVHLAEFEIAGKEWRNDIDNNLMYWDAALQELKNTRAQAVALGADSDWALIRDIDKELTGIESILSFYRNNKEICDAFISEQFMTAHTLLDNSQFEAQLKRFPDFERFKNEIDVGNELMLLSQAMYSESFSPDNIKSIQERAGALREKIEKTPKWGNYFPRKKIKRTLSQLELALANFQSASQLVSNWEKSKDISSMTQALQGIAELRLGYIFNKNAYAEQYNKKLVDNASAILTDQTIPLNMRSDLIAELMLLPETDDLQKNNLNALSFKFERDSNLVCNQLYKRWLAEPGERKTIAMEILKNSTKGSSYRAWSEDQLVEK